MEAYTNGSVGKAKLPRDEGEWTTVRRQSERKAGTVTAHSSIPSKEDQNSGEQADMQTAARKKGVSGPATS
jgi:hypothetical protein